MDQCVGTTPRPTGRTRFARRRVLVEIVTEGLDSPLYEAEAGSGRASGTDDLHGEVTQFGILDVDQGQLAPVVARYARNDNVFSTACC
ncbi:hypothetical protein HLK59_09545 [Streptomyces sp. S3(2020)]|nr:hypothetical protein [Streptomyces sp. S3(2020)]